MWLLLVSGTISQLTDSGRVANVTGGKDFDDVTAIWRWF